MDFLVGSAAPVQMMVAMGQRLCKWPGFAVTSLLRVTSVAARAYQCDCMFAIVSAGFAKFIERP